MTVIYPPHLSLYRKVINLIINHNSLTRFHVCFLKSRQIPMKVIKWQLQAVRQTEQHGVVFHMH